MKRLSTLLLTFIFSSTLLAAESKEYDPSKTLQEQLISESTDTTNHSNVLFSYSQRIQYQPMTKGDVNFLIIAEKSYCLGVQTSALYSIYDLDNNVSKMIFISENLDFESLKSFIELYHKK